MSVTIKPVGTLKSYTGNQAEVSAQAGETVRDTLRALGIPPEIVALVMVNDQQREKDYRLQDGDIVKIIAVIGGGD